jgi:ArsR family transcriptional regulator
MTTMTDPASPPLPAVDPALERSLALLKALTGGERLRIVAALQQAETCVCDLERLGMETALLSYHLRKLRETGLVRTRRDAQWVYYSIDPEAWREFAAPLAAFFGMLDLPPTATLGAGSRGEACADDSCRP